jgi:purine-binding chemotaxis protein CheW
VSADGEPGGGSYGLVTLGGATLAIPLAALREVVPRPADLLPLPVAAPGLAGALVLRDLVVPVIDLRERLGMAVDGTSPPLVVLLADEGELLGVLADGIAGIAAVDAADAVALRARTPGDPTLVSHAVPRRDGGGAVAVLDVGGVFALPAVPAVRERTVVDASAGDGRPSAALRHFVVVRCEDHVLALDVADVQMSIPPAVARASVVAGGPCLGVRAVLGVEAAVLDPLRLLGLGRLDPAEAHTGLVLRIDSGYVLLAVSELLHIATVPADTVLGVPDLALPATHLILGLLGGADAGVPCLVVDAARLRAEPAIGSYARTNVAAGGGVDEPATDASHGAEVRTYLTYRAGTTLATDMAQVVEVLPVPGELVPTPPTMRWAGLGSFIHRGCAVPLVGLAGLLGLPVEPTTQTACVVVVAVDGMLVGYLVDALIAIDHGTPYAEGDEPVDVAWQLGDGLEGRPLVGFDGAARLVPDVDLRAVGRTLAVPAAA